MDNISKQDIEKCVKNALSQKRIPSELRIREIVKEEIENYNKKEDEIQKQPILDKFEGLFTIENFKFLGRNIVLFLLVLLDVTCFKILVEGPRQIPSIQGNIVPAILFLLFILFIMIVLLFYEDL